LDLVVVPGGSAGLVQKGLERAELVLGVERAGEGSEVGVPATGRGVGRRRGEALEFVEVRLHFAPRGAEAGPAVVLDHGVDVLIGVPQETGY